MPFQYPPYSKLSDIGFIAKNYSILRSPFLDMSVKDIFLLFWKNLNIKTHTYPLSPIIDVLI